MYSAKLINGKTYNVLGHSFKHNQEKDVEKDVYDYLKGNSSFELAEKLDEAYTKTGLKKLGADEQRALIVEFGGLVGETNNEDERVALILQLQDENKKEDE